MSEQIRFPNFDQIINDCKKKMSKKFGEYGNSWVGEQNYEFWEQRLQKEVEEFLSAIKYGGTSFEGQKLEGIDIINVVAMMIENIEGMNRFWGRKPTDAVDPHWRYG